MPRARTSRCTTCEEPLRVSCASCRKQRPWLASYQTGAVVKLPEPVDESTRALPVDAWWLGTVVPKRHARRSVTRSLMKRQMHAAFERRMALPAGLWVLRLRTGFDVKQYPSAASDVLRRHVRDELDALIAGLASRLSAAERVT